jgi:hypothetical protein
MMANTKSVTTTNLKLLKKLVIETFEHEYGLDRYPFMSDRERKRIAKIKADDLMFHLKHALAGSNLFIGTKDRQSQFDLILSQKG